jgi:hypothetical protein
LGEPEGKQSFWSTIPGILTGIAALLTAITGLFLAFNHQQSPTSSNEHSTSTASSGPIAGASLPASPGPQPATAQTPAAKQSVTLTSRAGDVTQLSLKSFRHNYTDNAIELTSGQTIAFEKIRTISFLTVNGDDHQVDVQVTLTDGRTVGGALKTNYAFKGESDLGPFNIFVQDVKQIVFSR